MEWTGPLPGLKEKTAGALWVTLWPSEGAVDGILEEKEHRSSRPPSEPTKKVSASHGDNAKEVMPTELQPRACKRSHTAVERVEEAQPAGPSAIGAARESPSSLGIEESAATPTCTQHSAPVRAGLYPVPTAAPSPPNTR